MGVGPIKGLGRSAVFLDRDGVLNRSILRDGKPYSPASLDEFQISPDALTALEALKESGFLLIGVTNQPEVARGSQRQEVVEAMNSALLAALPLDDILVCYHDDGDGCECRKPRPGLLLRGSAIHRIHLPSSFMVGDRWKDVDAGRSAGCKTVFIDYGYNERASDSSPDRKVNSLTEAAEWILTSYGRNRLMNPLPQLNVKLFADGADKAGMLEMYRHPLVRGFTTNPTLMRKAGVSDYRSFAAEVLEAIPDRPISFEVFSDEFDEMRCQARKITGWGENVYVKIPITNTQGVLSTEVIRDLAQSGIKLNVTAVLTLDQVREVTIALAGGPPAFVSVFAGRIADTGRDPVPMMAAVVELLRPYPNVELIWASPRELLNIFQADAIGCHIITATNDILKKLDLVGRDLHEYSLDTVKMFRRDAVAAAYTL